jgi:sirohydrochlorin ferrochelatase
VVDLTFNIQHYRARAVEADEIARQATDPRVREMYLEAARSWRELAETAEALQRDSKT